MPTNSSTPGERLVQASGSNHARSQASTAQIWMVASFALGLLLLLPLAFAASGSLGSKVQSGIGVTTKRVGWYFRSGQWCADVRTLGFALKFIVEDDAGAPLETTPPAELPAKPGLPANADSLGAGQWPEADIRPGHRFPLL